MIYHNAGLRKLFLAFAMVLLSSLQGYGLETDTEHPIIKGERLCDELDLGSFSREFARKEITLAGRDAAENNEADSSSPPDDPILYFRRGEIFKYSLHKIEDAIKAYTKSLDLGLKESEVYANLAFCYKIKSENPIVSPEQRGEYIRSATDFCHQALRNNPNNLRALSYLGDLSLIRGYPSDAIMIYEQVLLKTKPDTEMWTRLGQAYLSIGKHRTALELFRKAQQSFETSPIISGDMKIPYVRSDIHAALRIGVAEALVSSGESSAARKELTEIFMLRNSINEEWVKKAQDLMRLLEMQPYYELGSTFNSNRL